MNKKIIAIIVAAAILISAVVVLFTCTSGKSSDKPDALVIMTEDLDGLFNPFFSTTAADANIVGMTQIGMLTTGFENNEVIVACGDNEAVVCKDYAVTYDSTSDKTVYTFVIKNGIKYSDGKPLTIEDVIFNLYVYAIIGC